MLIIIENPTYLCERIYGVIVSVLGSTAVYHGFKPRLGQTKDWYLRLLR